MLIDYEYRQKKLIVSYIDDNGNIKLKYYPWNNPTKFIICDDNDSDKSGKYVTWDGKSIKEIYTQHPNRYSIYDFLDKLPEEERKLLFDYKEPNIFFIDIENEIIDKKPQPHLAESAIQSVSIVNKDKVLVLGTKKLNKSEIDSIKDGINNHFDKIKTNYDFMYRYYESEYDMLLNFFKLMIPKMSVLTGWNFVNYDWVFLVNRARKLGIDPSCSSFTGNLRASWMQNDHSEIPAHRVIIDYMELYAKWDTSIKVKESQSLDFVSENVLGVKKINYEGNLKYLYENDYQKFILYNAIDSALVQQIHLKMKYIDILYGIATLSKIRVPDAFTTLTVTEGILREKMRNEKNVVFVKDDSKRDLSDSDNDMNVKGGWVKDPIVGMNSWTVCFDFASLYPTTMQEFNISADSYLGKIVKDRGKDIMDMIHKLQNGDDIYSIFNGHKIKIDKNSIITLNGAVFKNEDGVVKQVMGNIYKERKKYKKMMMSANEELKELEKKLYKLEKELNGTY
ncbi:MAG: DNA polymerase domain-containing protein [Saccharofermentanales bacterium]